LDELESEEEEIASGGGTLVESIVGRRRILTTWAVGEAWEIFSQQRAEVVKKSFRILGLTLHIDVSCDAEISMKGIENAYLHERLKDWSVGVLRTSILRRMRSLEGWQGMYQRGIGTGLSIAVSI